jgi:hypothetical protein
MTHWSTGSTAVGLGILAIPDWLLFFLMPPRVAAGISIALNLTGGGLLLFGRSGWADEWGHPDGVPARTVFGELVQAVAEDCDPFDPSPLRKCHAFDF